jgi:hypothetical protein
MISTSSRAARHLRQRLDPDPPCRPAADDRSVVADVGGAVGHDPLDRAEAMAVPAHAVARRYRLRLLGDGLARDKVLGGYSHRRKSSHRAPRCLATLRRGFYEAGQSVGNEVAKRGDVGRLRSTLVEQHDPVAHPQEVEDRLAAATAQDAIFAVLGLGFERCKRVAAELEQGGDLAVPMLGDVLGGVLGEPSDQPTQTSRQVGVGRLQFFEEVPYRWCTRTGTTRVGPSWCRSRSRLRPWIGAVERGRRLVG